MDAVRLETAKFRDPEWTVRGERRARVGLKALETLWFNTGTLCNLTCHNCYIESSPRNDRLAYLSRAEVRGFLDEIGREGLGTRLIGFTGGEPFMNPEFIGMLEDVLARGFRALVLTNAMKPMRKVARGLLRVRDERLTVRVSLDHYTREVHEAERGPRSWGPAIEGLVWLCRNGFRVDVAGRRFTSESEAELRAGYGLLFAELGVGVGELVIFPEMDVARDVPEITEACWGILGRSPESVMCATSRMVVRRRGAAAPAVLACTLLAYDERFELGGTLKAAAGAVALNHPHCASFCVLGGAACSR